jgi:hypothetical protein
MTGKIKTFLSLTLIVLVSTGTFQLLASASYLPINPPLPVGSETYWSNLARNAWQYFEPGAGVNAATGLHSAVNGWPYFTLWDLSVYIFAIIDAKQIGIITSDGTWGLDYRIEKVVSFLESMQLTSNNIPYVWYQATDGTPAFTKDPANACDYGALLVALHRIETIRPDLTSRINNIVNIRINSSYLAAGVFPNSIYDYYIGCGFAYFGYGNYPLISSALQILDRAENLSSVDVYGVALPMMDIGLEPLMLGMVNLDPNPQLANLSYRVYLASEARYNVTGKLTAFSEGPTGFGEPAYVYESVVTSAGQSWHLDVNVAPVAFLKVAASFLAYYNTSYAQRLMGSLQPTLLTFDGYWDGVDESSRVVNEATDKTNSMILDAAWYALSRIPDYHYTPAQTPSPIITSPPESTSPKPNPTATPLPTNQPSQSITPAPTLTANVAESASALYFGNRINFTATVDGGRAPFSYAWYVDNQLAETGTSPYYATDSLAVGSHHVYVQILDADHSSATTLTVAFEVLPNPNLSPSLTSSPSIPEFPLEALTLTFLTITLLVGILFKRKQQLR